MTFQVVLSRIKKRDLRGELANELAEIMKIPSSQLREELKEGELIVGRDYEDIEAEKIEALLKALGATVTVQKVGEPSPPKDEKEIEEVLITPDEYLKAMLPAGTNLQNKKGKFPFTLPFVLTLILCFSAGSLHVSSGAGGLFG